MRVMLQKDSSALVFSNQLLAIGDGKIPHDVSDGLITFPQNFCHFTMTKEELISNVFPNIIQNHTNYDWLSARAILAAKNKDVDDLNFAIQNAIPGQLSKYKSVDCVTNSEEATNYPTEFLNSLDVPGFPPHNLQLKIGSVRILIHRNYATEQDW